MFVQLWACVLILSARERIRSGSTTHHSVRDVKQESGEKTSHSSKENSDATRYSEPVSTAPVILPLTKRLLSHSCHRRGASFRPLGDQTLYTAVHWPLCDCAYSFPPAGVPRFLSSRAKAKAWRMGHLQHCHANPIWTQRPLSSHYGSPLPGVFPRHDDWGQFGTAADLVYAQACVARKASERTRAVAGFCRGGDPCGRRSEHPLSALIPRPQTAETCCKEGTPWA